MLSKIWRGSNVKVSIAVLMPTKNSAEWLDEVLLPLTQTEYAVQLVLVDGRSTDDTVEKAKQYFPNVIVRYDTSRNLAHVRNIALREARKLNVDYMAFIDSDVVVPPSFFKRCIKHLLSPKVAIVGLRFELERDPPQGFVAKFYRQRTDIQREGVYQTDYTTTACSMWKADLAENVVLDTRLKRAGEDVDFNLQLREKGDYIALVDADAPPAWHIRAATIKEELHRVKDHGFARALLLKTHNKSLDSKRVKKTVGASLLTCFGWVGLTSMLLLGSYWFVGLIPFCIIFLRQWMKTRQKWRLDYVFFGFLLSIIYFTRCLEGLVNYGTE